MWVDGQFDDKHKTHTHESVLYRLIDITNDDRDANPFARGSHWYFPPGSSWEHVKALAAPEWGVSVAYWVRSTPLISIHSIQGRLYFAGDATSTQFFTNAAGAFESGVRVANEIRAAHNAPPVRHARTIVAFDNMCVFVRLVYAAGTVWH